MSEPARSCQLCHRPPFPPPPTQYLDLSGNAISAQGCAAVAEVLGASGSLYSLALADCPLRDDGAAALAEALGTNIGLFKLDLSGTQVGGPGHTPCQRGRGQRAVAGGRRWAGAELEPSRRHPERMLHATPSSRAAAALRSTPVCAPRPPRQVGPEGAIALATDRKSVV